MPFRENTASGKVETPDKHVSGTKEVARSMHEKPHPGVRFERISMAKDKPHHGTKTR